MARPSDGPIWPTNKRKSRQQHSRKPGADLADDTSVDFTAIARELYRAGKIPATMLDFVTTDRTKPQPRMENI